MIGGRINIGKYEEYLTENTKLKVEVHQTSSIKKARLELFKLISKNIPGPVYVDMCFLDYLNLPETAHFGGHTIVIFGIDEDEGIAYLSDRDGKDFKITDNEGVIARDYHKIPLDTLEKARNSTYKPYPPHNKWVTFNLNDFAGVTEKAILKALTQNSELMLNAPIKSVGLKGINTFAREVLKWSDYPGDKLKWAVFNSYIMINQIGGTGGGAFRKMYGNFLLETAGIINSGELKETGLNYIKISQIWDEVGFLFLEIFETENKKLLAEISMKLKEIYQQEVVIWQDIDEHLKEKKKIIED